ncbi:MAG: DNA repair protein RecN [Candidatus Eremiobacteraeota bacterium]|nr:DNA repair protein RecN [Candidatus Eremiobacteraeota bacterium]
MSDATGAKLLRLTVENLGLIERAEIEFSDGLTVLTGETGSGKTMVLGGLALALGGRADADLVRSAAERACATLEIEPDARLRALLAEAGVALAEDDVAVVQREVLASGRSQARINGVAAPASKLREVGAAVVDVVSQHEAQRLFSAGYALDVVDRYGGAEQLARRARVRAAWERARATRERIAALQSDAGAALERAAYARFALGEIDAARIEDDEEDERLRARRDVLANAERIAAALTAASDALEEEGGGVDALGAAETALGALARYGTRFAELAATAGALQSEAGELAAQIARERDGIDTDPAELDAVTARLDALDRLKRTYGGSLAAVRLRRNALAEEIADVDDRDERLAAAEREAAEAEQVLAAEAAALGAERRRAAAALERTVAREFGALALPAARLRFAFTALERVGPEGAEHVELHFAPNPGEAERPLARIASGGELSRVLLALVVVLADRRERTALVFDEIDAGIGGAIASAVGARLARLAQSAQVICVTHLAQIASRGDAHVALRKRTAKRTTTIEAQPLAAQERRAEIARMLSGEEAGVALDHAAELLASRGN